MKKMKPKSTYLKDMARPWTLLETLTCKSCGKKTVVHLPGKPFLKCTSCNMTVGPIPPNHPTYGDVLRCLINNEIEREKRRHGLL